MATIAKLLFLGLMAASWGINLAKHGEPREGEYSARTATLALLLQVALLALGGFFEF